MLYHFADCLLDTRRYVIQRAGQTVPLRPKVFALLVCLIESRDRVLSKDELCEQVWPAQFISNAALESTLRYVRQAVGDDGRRQGIIKTLHGYGYQFVATLENMALERLPTSIRQAAPFLGRERDMTTLHELLGQVTNGTGRVVGLSGEHGIGKSRLLDEFRDSIDEQPLTYVVGHCLPYCQNTPYAPLREILRQLCQLPLVASPEMMTAQVTRLLQRADLAVETHADSLLHLLDGYAHLGQESGAPPEMRKLRMLETLQQLFVALSRQQPLVLLVEDLHWCDTCTDDWLQVFQRQLERAPILLMITFPLEAEPDWFASSSAFRLCLEPLGRRYNRRLMRAMLNQEGLGVEEEAIPWLQEGGSPLYLELISRIVAEDGSDSLAGQALDTIQDGIRAQLGRLSAASRQLVQTAAVLGPVFSHDLLHAVWEDAPTLEEGLHELVQRAFLTAAPRQHEARDYAFFHTLVWEVVYSSLLPECQQALHGRTAKALAALYAQPSYALGEVLAHHYTQQPATAEALPHLVRSADAALAYGAYPDALGRLQEAQRHLDALSGTARQGQELEMTLRLAQVLYAWQHVTEVRDLLQRHHDAATSWHQPALAGRYALLCSQLSARMGDWPGAQQQARQAVELGARADDRVTLGQAQIVLARVSYRLEAFQQGIAAGREAVRQFDDTTYPYRLGMAQISLGLNALLAGELALAEAALTDAARLGARLSEPHLEAYAHWSLGSLYVCRELPGEAIDACQRGMACSPDPLNTAFSRGWLGYAYLEQGKASEAIHLLEQASEAMQHHQYRRMESVYRVGLGQAYLVRGRPERAQELVQQALALALESHYQMGGGWAYRALGRIAQSTDNLPLAEQHYTHALTTFTDRKARFEMARTHLLLADLMVQMDNRVLLRQHLQEAHRLCVRLHLSPYIERIEQRRRVLDLFPL